MLYKNQTATQNKTETYSDIPININPHPNTKQLLRATDEQAIFNSIRNLVFIMPDEIPCKPYIGSRIKSLLFENASSAVENSLKSEIETVLKKESRILVRNVAVAASKDMKAYHITIKFSTVNNPREISYSFLLQRIR